MATKQKLTTLGIELGSTRIKAVLTSFDGTILASGMHDWENRFEDGYWTYHLDDVWAGIRDAYRDLALNYENTYGEVLQTVGAIGVSPMMHGYLPFDCNGQQLTAFRTWRTLQLNRRKCFDRAFSFQHSSAMEHSSLLSGHS